MHIIWFRQDLRLADNPALSAAAKAGKILPIFIYDEVMETYGAASKWWLHHSLKSLDADLQKHGAKLHIFKGDAADVLNQLDGEKIYWNRCYEPDAIARDKDLKEQFSVESFSGSLLHEPWTVFNKQGNPFQVFTPMWKHIKQQPVRPALSAPEKLDATTINGALNIDDLGLLPSIQWDAGFYDMWDVSEEAAHDMLSGFLENKVATYKDDRNTPEKEATSYLSPYLHWGQISPVQIWHQTNAFMAAHPAAEDGADHFLSEVAWREFSYQLLYTFPELPEKPLKSNFEHFPWAENYGDALQKWQRGQTGYPIVDAGMRELWHTGYMHNRIRMIVASFLVKDLLIPWQEGEKWFWDTLVDADLANNSASWQWVAGCGADASPYFRVFNPITQGKKFDPEGTYVKKWVPELAHLLKDQVHTPWEAPLGVPKDYFKPMIDHAEARKFALEAYENIKGL